MSGGSCSACRTRVGASISCRRCAAGSSSSAAALVHRQLVQVVERDPRGSRRPAASSVPSGAQIAQPEVLARAPTRRPRRPPRSAPKRSSHSRSSSSLSSNPPRPGAASTSARHAVGHRQGRVHRDRAAHRAADEGGALEAGGVETAARSRDVRVRLAGRAARPSVAAHVVPHHAVPSSANGSHWSVPRRAMSHSPGWRSTTPGPSPTTSKDSWPPSTSSVGRGSSCRRSAARASRRSPPAAPAARASPPTTGMKFVSPPQRGTTCQCRCPGIPAPATRPRFSPTLNPCGCRGRRAAPGRDRCSSDAISAFSSAVSSSSSPTWRTGSTSRCPGLYGYLARVTNAGSPRAGCARRPPRPRAARRRRSHSGGSSLRAPGCTPSARGSRGGPSRSSAARSRSA